MKHTGNTFENTETEKVKSEKWKVFKYYSSIQAVSMEHPIILSSEHTHLQTWKPKVSSCSYILRSDEQRFIAMQHFSELANKRENNQS